MVRNNNIISFGHFHKDWQRHVRTHFGQPFKKSRRQVQRTKKLKSKTPRPMHQLRPLVHCPTVRYQTKTRCGRGFSLQELKSANINPHFAKSIGIAVDTRRKNKSYESLLINKSRLLVYMGKLVVFPKKVGAKTVPKVSNWVKRDLNRIDAPRKSVKAKVPTEEEKKFPAFSTLRKARTAPKLLSRKLKRNKSSSNQFEDFKI